ncbi:serine/threonine-protein kinase (plasmid) [Streptomyces phaeoluteigriseus]|uniref:Serine/threonine-protein kinase n=2 Tax=Streptomyces phaeoluteigriseus TaxID=114686 RepID=A0ABY4ZLB4_9ACTN|nr:serine/threonine-protein kinase [Streptomyces phaeoluteigriseus]
MGRVYLGRSASGRAVAVKVVRAELAENAMFRQRFAREVEAARRVTGFFTAAVVDAEPEGSPAWLATAYVPGVSLDEAVHAHGAWPKRSVLALGAGLAEALEAIHAAGLIHRDLKPSNVLIAADGPRVIDFGISVAAEASALTDTGMVVGTCGFMSPEQVTGKAVGPASDVFALGAVLTFAATGAGPFGTGSAHAVNFRAVYEEPDLSGLPPGLEVISRCLAKDPSQRPGVSPLLEELAEGLGEADGRSAATRMLTEARWLPEGIAQSHPALTTTPTNQEQTQVTVQISRQQSAASTSDDADVVTALKSGAKPAEAASGHQAVPLPSARIAPMRRSLRSPVRKAVAVGVVAVIVVAFTAWRLFEGSERGHESSERSPRWTFSTDGAVESSSAVADGTVYVPSMSGNLYAVDAVTAKRRWISRISKKGVSTPAVANGTAYVSSEDGYLHAVDAATGKKRWRFYIGAWGIFGSSPVVAGGSVYVGGGDNMLHAVDAATGRQHWTFEVAGVLGVSTSPAFADGTVYASDGNNLYAVDAVTGKKRWSYKGTFESEFMASPVVTNGTVYVGTSSGMLYAVNATNGKKKWSYLHGDPGGMHSAPTVANGTVYASLAHGWDDDGGLLALDSATGKERWTMDTGGAAYTTPAVVDGTVYVSDDTLHAVDAATGEEQWHLSTEVGPYSSLVAADGTVYVGNDKGKLYAVATKDE